MTVLEDGANLENNAGGPGGKISKKPNVPAKVSLSGKGRAQKEFIALGWGKGKRAQKKRTNADY